MPSFLVALLGLAGVLATAVVTWLVARRQRSGQVSTTDAEALWAEGKQMRAELRDETLLLRAEVATMRAETLTLREEAVAMRVEMEALRAEAVLLRSAASAATAEVDTLQGRLRDCEAKS